MEGPIKVGDHVCTAGGVRGSFVWKRHNEGYYTRWTGVIYKAQARTADLKVIFRRTEETFGPVMIGREPPEELTERLKEIAPYRWLEGVQQNQLVPNFENLTEKFSAFVDQHIKEKNERLR